MSTQEARSGVGRAGGGRERRMVPAEEPRTYYDRRVVKPPIWTPEVPWYFFLGGLGGASATLAFVASRAGSSALAKRAWGVAFGAISLSPVLLTLDLGRPERFINMLRVFKLSSPMSVGSWLLALNGLAVTPPAAHHLLGLSRRRPLGEAASAALGLPLATYTAVLISNSAIPVWSEARRELPLLFAAGAATSAGAAATAITPPASAGPARRLAIGGAVCELAVTEYSHRELGELAEPYGEGEAGAYSRAARVLTGAGAAVLALGGRRRLGALAGSGLLLAGAVCMRWSVFKAGGQSAEDPKYTVGPQRERLRENGPPHGT